MSFEAWGTPPEPEPRYCPVCDQESHDPTCELGKMQARAFLAERQRDELLTICRNVIERGIGASDVNAMKAAIASAKDGK